jgi:hypothetical protein
LEAQTKNSTSHNDSVTTKILLDLDRRIQEGLVIGDSILLDTVLAADFIFTHGFLNGGQEDRNKLLKNISTNQGFYFYRKVDSAVVELHGDIALVLGNLTIKRKPIKRNAEIDNYCYKLAFIHLYAWRNNRWVFISHRTAKNLIPPQPCKD